MNRRMRNRKHAAATRRRKKESMVQMLEELAQLRKVGRLRSPTSTRRVFRCLYAVYGYG